VNYVSADDLIDDLIGDSLISRDDGRKIWDEINESISYGDTDLTLIRVDRFCDCIERAVDRPCAVRLVRAQVADTVYINLESA
jgi:hypothetical protein